MLDDAAGEGDQRSTNRGGKWKQCRGGHAGRGAAGAVRHHIPIPLDTVAAGERAKSGGLALRLRFATAFQSRWTQRRLGSAPN
ncbi:hypothetical protein COCOBI_13-4180 [Coccomyxa sp. Obi]|nr:hypothetical protein COCOBI_13-4180 [Coccomyxa sp. Obi]